MMHWCVKDLANAIYIIIFKQAHYTLRLLEFTEYLFYIYTNYFINESCAENLILP